MYEFWIGDRINQPMLAGNGNFKQYFSGPQEYEQPQTKRQDRHRQALFRVGQSWYEEMDCPLYEIAMKVESYTGSSGNSRGSANVTKNLLALSGSGTNQFSLVTKFPPPVCAGTVTRNPSNSSYASNATVQLTATASPGWRFVGWEGDVTGTTRAPPSLL